MLELGSETQAAHVRVGKRAAKVLDVLIAYGPLSKITADEARKAGLRSDQVVEASTFDEIIQNLQKSVRDGDDVLVKGSLAMGMSAVVQGIRAEGEG